MHNWSETYGWMNMKTVSQWVICDFDNKIISLKGTETILLIIKTKELVTSAKVSYIMAKAQNLS